MKAALVLIVLAGVFAQDSIPTDIPSVDDYTPPVDNSEGANTQSKIRIKGLKDAVRQQVNDALTLAGYAIPPGVDKKEWKAARKAAIATGVKIQEIEQEAINKFLDQGVTDGTIDAVTAAAYRAKQAQKQEERGEKKASREVKSGVKAIADAVRFAQDAALIEGGFLQEDSTKTDRKAAVKQATAAGIDLNAIAAEVVDQLLGEVDSEVADRYASKIEEKQQAKENKKEARQQNKQEKQEARQAKKDLKVLKREVQEAIKLAQAAALGVTEGEYTKEDRKAFKKQAKEQGIDLGTIREEVTAEYLASADTDLAAAYTARAKAKQAEREAKRQAKKDKKAAEKQAKKDKKAAEREAKKQAKRDKKAAEKQAKKDKKAAEKQAKKDKKDEKAADKKDKKAAERQAKKDKKSAERQAKKEANQYKKDEKSAQKDANKQSKVAGRLQKKVKSSKQDKQD